MNLLFVLMNTPIPLPNNYCLHQKFTKTILAPIIIWFSHEQKELENNSFTYLIFWRTLPSKGPPWVHVEHPQAKPQVTKKHLLHSCTIKATLQEIPFNSLFKHITFVINRPQLPIPDANYFYLTLWCISIWNWREISKRTLLK